MKKLYRPWYEEYPERFQREQADMAARGFVQNDEALRLHRRVQFIGMSAQDPSRPLVVKYPGQFPSFPPRVYSHTPGHLLQRHHNPSTGEICLFGPGQPRWSAREDGVKAVDEAETIVRHYSPGGAPVQADNVPEPASALFKYAENAAIIVPPDLAVPQSPGEATTLVTGTFQVRFRPESRSKLNRFTGGRGVVLSIQIGPKTTQAGQPYSEWCQSQNSREHSGTLVVLPEPPPFWANAKKFHRWLAKIKVNRANWMAFVFPEQSESAAQRRMAWLTVRTFDSFTSAMYLIRTFPNRLDERQVRVPGLGGLASKKVVFIGCGSMGSKIAVPLAATGLYRCGLVDGDIYKPENAVRHEVGVDHYGSAKVTVLANRLASVNPAVAQGINPAEDLIVGMIGSDIPVEFDEKLFNLIASADLVVETTGSHGVSRWVNDTCHGLGIPALYATVTNGAWSGEIVRVIPGQTACWLCWFAQFEHARPPAASAPEAGLFAPGCDQPTFTGTSYEIGAVANLAAWMAAETLLRAEPGRQDFSGDYLLWVSRTGDGAPTLAPQVLPVRKREYCPVCNSE